METPQESILIKRPPRLRYIKEFELLGIFVLDGSGSMKETTARRISKADTVHLVVRDLFSRIKASSKRDCFYFSIVNYDYRSVVKLQPTLVKDIDEHADYFLMDELDRATCISEGLKNAKKIAEDFLSQSQAEGLPRSVVVMLLTDGVDMTQHETISLANALKQMENVTLTGCFFETEGADIVEMKRCVDYIQSLCSSPDYFRMVNDYLPLREFFFNSISYAKLS
jgi:hypothetical protein